MGARQQAPRVVARTADLTIVAANYPSGTLFTNRGATGAVVFTLPPPSKGVEGWRYRFRGVADQNITVRTATADTLIALNDAAADSVAAQTAANKIGAVIEAECDGISWFGTVLHGTQTVNT